MKKNYFVAKFDKKIMINDTPTTNFSIVGSGTELMSEFQEVVNDSLKDLSLTRTKAKKGDILNSLTNEKVGEYEIFSKLITD